MDSITPKKRTFWTCTRCQKRFMIKNFEKHQEKCARDAEREIVGLRQKCCFCEKEVSKKNIPRHQRICSYRHSRKDTVVLLDTRRVFENCPTCKKRYLQVNLKDHLCKPPPPPAPPQVWEVCPKLEGESQLVRHFKRVEPVGTARLRHTLIDTPNEMTDLLHDDRSTRSKWCRECDITVPVIDFTRHRREVHPDNAFRWCAPCQKFLSPLRYDVHLSSKEHINGKNQVSLCESCGELIMTRYFEIHMSTCVDRNGGEVISGYPMQAEQLDGDWESRYEFNAIQFSDNHTECSLCGKQNVWNHECAA